MSAPKRILITPGEPAGIGPDVAIQIAQQNWQAELVAVGDGDLLLQRAKQIGLPLTLEICDLDAMPSLHQPGSLKIISLPLNVDVNAGILNPFNASYVIRTLETAASICLQKKADAIVTGPVNKKNINKTGVPFLGHTEFFADFCGVPHTIMLFVVENLKVALATTHLPLSQVPSAITKDKLDLVLSILNDELKKKFYLDQPRILVCGLNPHSGEGGYLGREEIDVITPALNELREKGYALTGPLPADTIFTPKHLKEADVVLAMYHDQALPLVKYMGFGHAVNVTLGLPFVRTSVDHGTAIDIAGTGKADPGSMVAAINLAVDLVKNN